MNQPTSPPTVVDEWELSQDLQKIEQQWPLFWEILKDPVPFQVQNPKISGWSAGLQAGHIALGASFMAQMAQECLDDPKPNPAPKWADFTELIFSKGGFSRGAGQAPPAMRPESHDREFFLEKLELAKTQWRALTARIEEIRKARATRKHFAFGDLSASDWARLCALHNAHHLRIIEDIQGA